MRSILLSLMLLTGCGTVPVLCKTTCGLELVNTSSGWSCEAFQHAEDVALAHFDRDVRGDPRFSRAYACRSLDGWRVSERPEDIIVRNDVLILGVTYCAGGIPNSLDVARSKIPHQGALAHELGHVIQNCDPLESNAEDPQHAGWGEHHLYWSIERARSEP